MCFPQRGSIPISRRTSMSRSVRSSWSSSIPVKVFSNWKFSRIHTLLPLLFPNLMLLGGVLEIPEPWNFSWAPASLPVFFNQWLVGALSVSMMAGDIRGHKFINHLLESRRCINREVWWFTMEAGGRWPQTLGPLSHSCWSYVVNVIGTLLVLVLCRHLVTRSRNSCKRAWRLNHCNIVCILRRSYFLICEYIDHN